jgi:hypothetical protein
LATLDVKPTIVLNVSLRLTEEECRALDALTGYGDEKFVKDYLEHFYKDFGQHYLKPHEAGFYSFFKSVRELIPRAIARVDKARNEFESPISYFSL